MSSPADVGLLDPGWAGTRAEELTSDDALVRALVRVESALLHALADAAIAPAMPSLAAVSLDARTLALDAVAGGNPVIPLVRALRAAVPDDVAAWVHHGATSQDVLDSALMLVAADVVASLDTSLSAIARHLAGLASVTRDVPVVGRTLTQQALPTTLGLRAAGWLAGVHDAVRLLRALSLPASLGGPVGTLAAYGDRGPAVLRAYAEALGLAEPVLPWHTRRTPVLALAHALSVTGAALGKVAADLLVMGQSEVGEAREGSGGPSSSMAHKSNPTQSVLVASAARQLPALGSVLAASGVAEQERPSGAWHAEWASLRAMLRLAGGAAERAAA